MAMAAVIPCDTLVDPASIRLDPSRRGSEGLPQGLVVRFGFRSQRATSMADMASLTMPALPPLKTKTTIRFHSPSRL